MAVALALSAALSFGVADFLGGVASRRAPLLVVVGLAQAAGLVLIVAALPLTSGDLSSAAVGAGLVAGVSGAGGLALYFRSLAIGPMGLTAPMAAVVGAVVPVATGLVLGERLTVAAATGVALGLAAVVLASRPAQADAAGVVRDLRGPLYALAGGAGFGIFFIALDQAPADSGVWPLVVARVGALAAVGVAWAVARPSRPDPRDGRTAVVSGVIDMVANLLFLEATRAGLLTLTTLITSLYPVVVVVLARAVLAERLSSAQRAGAVLSLGAVALIAVGG